MDCRAAYAGPRGGIGPCAMTEPASRRGRPTLVKEPLPLDSKLLVRMHDLMVKARVLEERLIQMYKQGHGYFWIGGPGEEAFNVRSGPAIKKGQGLDYDYLHLPLPPVRDAARDGRGSRSARCGR